MSPVPEHRTQDQGVNQRRQPPSRPRPYSSQNSHQQDCDLPHGAGLSASLSLSLGWQLSKGGAVSPQEDRASLTSTGFLWPHAPQCGPSLILSSCHVPAVLLAPDYFLFAWSAPMSTDPQLLGQLPDCLPTSNLPALHLTQS